MPTIYNALELEVTRTVLGETTKETLWCEVAQHLGGGRIRAIALGSTDGVQRGARIRDTGQPVTVPVGEETLGRGFNLVGDGLAGRPRALDLALDHRDDPGHRRAAVERSAIVREVLDHVDDDQRPLHRGRPASAGRSGLAAANPSAFSRAICSFCQARSSVSPNRSG